MNTLETISLILCIIPTILYILIVYKQYKCIEEKTLRLIILSTRAAACLPAYAFCIYVSFMEPYFYALMEGPITFIEGYSFYCFFTLIVVNCGGPEATVKAMEQTNEPLACTKLLCKCCKVCPSTKRDFYRNSNRYLFHFCWTRTIITVLGSLCYYSKSKLGYLAYIACSCLGAAILLYAPFYLFNLYDNIYRSCTNIYGVGKVVLMKVSVSLITYLGVMEIFLVKFDGGYRLYGDERQQDASVATHRAVCLLLLALLSMLAVLSYPSFARRMTAPALLFQPPRSEPPLCPCCCSRSRSRSPCKGQAELREDKELSLCGFLLQLASVLDIVNTMELEDDHGHGHGRSHRGLAVDDLSHSAQQADAMEKGGGGGAKGFGRIWEDCWTLPGEGEGEGEGDTVCESSFSERRMMEMLRLGSRSGTHSDGGRNCTAHCNSNSAAPHTLGSTSSSSSGSFSASAMEAMAMAALEEDCSPNKSVDVSFGSIYPQQDLLSPGIPALLSGSGSGSGFGPAAGRTASDLR